MKIDRSYLLAETHYILKFLFYLTILVTSLLSAAQGQYPLHEYQGMALAPVGYHGIASAPVGYQGMAPVPVGYQGFAPAPVGYQGMAPAPVGYQGMTAPSFQMDVYAAALQILQAYATQQKQLGHWDEPSYPPSYPANYTASYPASYPKEPTI